MDIQLPFGLDKTTNKIVHISEISNEKRGYKCNCVCPQCEYDLIARLGNIRTHHFAHKNENCKNALETALHMLVKELLKENKKLRIPPIELKRYNGSIINVVKEENLTFDTVELEKKIDDIIPDVILYKNNAKLLVEIAVTHPIDEIKFKKIKKLDLSTIEIDFKKYNFNEFNRDKINDILISSIKNKKWIYNRKKEKVEQKLIEEEKERQSQNDRNREIKFQAKEQEINHLETYILNKKREQDFQTKEKDKYYRILETMSEKYINNKINQFNKEIFTNKHWLSISNKLYINIDTTPAYLNIEVNGEMAIECDRRIWQSYIYYEFIKNRKNKIIKVSNVIKWLKNDSELPLNEYLKNTRLRFQYNQVPIITDAVYEYFMNLTNLGILKNISSFGKYGSEFKVMCEKV